MSFSSTNICNNQLCKDSEKRSYGILAVFESAGYKKDDIIAGVKSIDNWFGNNPGKKLNDLITEVTSVINIKRGPKVNPLIHDKKFIDICQSIGFTPKTQYQLLQLTRDNKI